MNKKERILQLATNEPKLSAPEIAKRLKIKVQYVHTVLYLNRKKSTVTAPVQKQSTVTEVQGYYGTVTNLHAQIADLKAVIRYLEQKVQHGPSIRSA